MATLFIQSILAWALYRKCYQLKEMQSDLADAIEVRNAERTGRINVQKQLREEKKTTDDLQGFNYKPIGHVESPFPERRGTPRQPILVTAARGKIRFNKHVIQLEHFKELEQFSHVWILFVFHENTNTVQKDRASSNNSNHVNSSSGSRGKHTQSANANANANVCIAKVKPPRLHGQKVGCLSTRSPHRPNNIGLSLCEIVG